MGRVKVAKRSGVLKSETVSENDSKGTKRKRSASEPDIGRRARPCGQQVANLR